MLGQSALPRGGLCQFEVTCLTTGCLAAAHGVNTGPWFPVTAFPRNTHATGTAALEPGFLGPYSPPAPAPAPDVLLLVCVTLVFKSCLLASAHRFLTWLESP